MSKKNKKKDEDKQQINAVNTEVDIENAYYNYDEPVVYETKKPGFFKKLFRGKKKVTSSKDLAQEDNFYGNYGATDNTVYANVDIQSKQVLQDILKIMIIMNHLVKHLNNLHLSLLSMD